jgi:hypothetical protein
MAHLRVRTLCAGCQPSLTANFVADPAHLAITEAVCGPARCDNGCPDLPVATFVAPWPSASPLPNQMTLKEVHAMRAAAGLRMAIFDNPEVAS